MNEAPTREEVSEALSDRAVRVAVNRAVRDQRIRAAFRLDGGKVDERIEQLRGPWYDVDGRPCYLSHDRVRSIVYQKRCEP